MDKQPNQILSQFSAIVDGEVTGFSGCDSAASCPKAHLCLRSDERLTVREKRNPDNCRIFIPVAA